MNSDFNINITNNLLFGYNSPRFILVVYLCGFQYMVGFPIDVDWNNNVCWGWRGKDSEIGPDVARRGFVMNSPRFEM
jgi:hypothetical protein